MGNRFIHTYGGRECVAAYIGNTRKLEQPLYGAVFAIFAVQSWEDCVKAGALGRRLGAEPEARGRNCRGIGKRVHFVRLSPNFRQPGQRDRSL